MINSDFKNENERFIYLHQVYNCIPDELLAMLKYKNYSDKELVILKLVLDFSTNYLKEFDTPYFKQYRKEIIKA